LKFGIKRTPAKALPGEAHGTSTAVMKLLKRWHESDTNTIYSMGPELGENLSIFACECVGT
jgi:hypothetical protein